jgi:uroporphyrin-III C-methyltransferase
METGIVYLVGAGPGDPDLITVKGARLLRDCDAVVYDRLVNPSLIPAHAEKHYVGKCDGEHHASQDEINALLIRLAQQGQRVVRLKGGDPFVFGRGGEEALALAEAGIPFKIVPGVTAGTAVPAYAGIPVTHRGISTSVTFVTANTNGDVDWPAIAQLKGTVVIFMSALTWPTIKRHFAPETPAAAIHWGTYPTQRVVTGTVATLEQLTSPTTIVLGDVVRLRDRIDWFRPAPSPSASPASTAILLIDHGSRLYEANAMLHDVAALVAETAGVDTIVQPAHMELAEPTIAQGFATCVERGAREIVAVPYMLSPGRHSTQDIPRLVAEAAAPFPNLEWRVADALGVDDRLAHLVLDRALGVREAAVPNTGKSASATSHPWS